MPQPRFSGQLPTIGASAPALRYVKNDRTEASLADHKGHVVVLLMFPSVDTGVCATETRTFNQKATGLGAKVLSVSADLPFALNRFCAAEGIANVETGSDFRHRDADAWGTRIAEGPMAGVLGRVTFVIDKEGIVRYCEVTPELGAEPDYEAALNAAKALL
ncbi:MAG: thiol peroxidase [Flavobacteriales bacterium]|nr:MAG: thiol peroxidase [Flavobacteriales bacterium]